VDIRGFPDVHVARGSLPLGHGHLWGQREVTIPIGAVAKVETDQVTLSLSKDETGVLEAMPLHRLGH
jgi:hypothetical protein